MDNQKGSVTEIRKKGEKATKWEQHWLWCQDNGTGWIHPMKGGCAKLFAGDYAGVRIRQETKKPPFRRVDEVLADVGDLF